MVRERHPIFDPLGAVIFCKALVLQNFIRHHCPKSPTFVPDGGALLASHWLPYLLVQGICLEAIGMRFTLKRETNPNFLNGVPELLVLRLLKGREMYGYELVQAIKDTTAETIVLGEGVVYPVLHMLEREGALRSRRQSVSGRSRIYYSLTPNGERRLQEVSGAWQRITDAIGGVLRGPQHV